MAKRFYCISIAWGLPPEFSKITKVEEILSHFGDWFRFSSSTWIFFTAQDDIEPQVLFGAVRTIIDAVNESFLVTEFSPTTYIGWGPPELEKWVTERQEMA